MKEKKLKEAFLRIKEDILNLGREIARIRQELLETTILMKQINEEITAIKIQEITKTAEKAPEIHEKIPTHIPTHPQENPTHTAFPMENPTDAVEIMGLLSPNNQTPTGNEGVPTDKPTNQQTNQHIIQHTNSQEKSDFEVPKNINNIIFRKKVVPNTESKIKQIESKEIKQEKPITEHLLEATQILESLDALKKEIRRKFKRITRQEMLVFSTIYTLEEQDPEAADYKKIAFKLGLSESSIRDYVNKLISKGIPIIKERVNNKRILLHISQELKEIATLSAIMRLREI